MKNIKDLIIGYTINEARINYWMVVNHDTNSTFLVAATTIDEAKNLVVNASGNDLKELSAWLINDLTKTKESRIVYDSDMVKVKGDKKF